VLLCNKGLPAKIGLCFHALEPRFHEAFAEVVAYFRNLNYRFTDAHEFLAKPDERCVFVSFDDNFRSWYESLPLFDRLDVRGTFYVNTLPLRNIASEETIDAYYDRIAYPGPRFPLSEGELIALSNAGHTIGAHSHSHLNLAGLSVQAAQKDILRGKEELERILGRRVQHFAYPYGLRRYFSDELRTYCKNIGFETIANAIPGLQHNQHAPLNIQRTGWQCEKPLLYNMTNISIDGSLFEHLTGKSAVG
jgi:peptidoglycan/xylan/chitin deacetylase (PgdA/CDA1 family)